MSSLNKATLIGRLGKDPVVKAVGDGMVANFSIATSRAWGKGDSRQEKTEWHNIVAWGKQAEAIGKYLAKGSQVYVEGEIQYRAYEKDGQTRYVTEINASSVIFLDTRMPGRASNLSVDENSEPAPSPNPNQTRKLASEAARVLGGQVVSERDLRGRGAAVEDDLPF